jgi:hypothetical protein
MNVMDRVQLKEPNWTDSETLMSEPWKNPLIPIDERLLIADGAIAWRQKLINKLRKQLAEKDAQIAALDRDWI